MEKQINSWAQWQEKIINPFLKSEDGERLANRVKASRKLSTVFPKSDDIFNAFYYTPIDDIKIVLIGLDPYNKGNHAHGLAFSSQQSNTPPSLKVIFKELRRDIYPYFTDEQWKQFFPNNNLTNWAKRGILLLNKYLTVKEGEAKSHAQYGWVGFINKVFEFLNDYDKPLVFILWGNDAKELKPLIKNTKHLILEGYHPASDCYNPEELKFYGCGHFSKAIQFLREMREEDCSETDINIEKYFKEEMFPEIKKIIQSEAYPYTYKSDNELADDLKKGLKITYNYGFNFTLTK